MRNLGNIWNDCHDGTIPLGRWQYQKKLTINDVVYYSDSIVSTSIDRGFVQDSFSLGGAFSTKVNITLIPQSDYKITKENRITLQIRVAVKNEDESFSYSEWNDFGVFYVQSAERQGNKWNIEGYDLLKYSDVPYSQTFDTQITWPASCVVAIQKIADFLGVEIDSRSGIDESIFIENPDKISMRDTLRYIGTLHGGGFYITEENKLRLLTVVNGESVADITSSNSKKIITGDSFSFDKVLLRFGEDFDDVFVSGEGTKSIEIFNPWATQYACNKIFNLLKDYVYTPFDISSTDINPAVEIGDPITVKGVKANLWQASYDTRMYVNVDMPDGVQQDSPAYSADPSTGGGGSGTVADFSLLYDYNEKAIEVGLEEKEIANINIDITKGNQAQAQLLVNFVSNQDSLFVIRIYDNENQQYYSPIVSPIKKGFNSIGIPHALVRLLPQSHNFSITAQSRSGKVFIQPRGVMYDMEVLGSSIVPIINDIQDISIRQPKMALSPTDVYVIGNSSEDYPVVLRAPYIFGRKYRASDFNDYWAFEDIRGAKNLLVEFNGVFELLGSDDNYSLVTQEKPWIFWIDYNDNLWAQYGDQVSSRMLVSTEVIQASTVKGWTLKDSPSEDMGLIISYIKYNGTVAYRQILGLVDIDNDNTTLGSEYILTQAGQENTRVQVLRLNDYRIAFTVSGIDKIFISERNYVGQAAPREYVQQEASLDNRLTFFTPYHVSELPYDKHPVVETEDNQLFKLTARYDWVISGDKNMCFNIKQGSLDIWVSDVYVDQADKSVLYVRLNKAASFGRMVISPNILHLYGRHKNGSKMDISEDIELYNILFGFNEHISSNASIQVSFASKPLLTTDVETLETIQQNADITAIFSPKGIIVKEKSFEENISSTASIEADFLPSYVGQIIG